MKRRLLWGNRLLQCSITCAWLAFTIIFILRAYHAKIPFDWLDEAGVFWRVAIACCFSISFACTAGWAWLTYGDKEDAQ